MENQDDSIFHLYLQKKLLEMSDMNKQLNYKDAKTYVAYIRLPKELHPAILKEMEKLGLTKQINKNVIEITNCEECKKLEKINKLYHKLGLW